MKKQGFIKLNPAFKDYIWGGTKLNTKYNKNSGFDKIAESWELSVHPDDEMAKKLENQNGKTEMWYVVEADEDAKIIYGVKEDIAKEEL